MTWTQSTIFGDNPLCQATKQRLTVKWLKMIKNEMRKERTQREREKLGHRLNSVPCRKR